MRSVSVRSNIGELRQLTVRKIALAQFSILSFEIFSFFVSSRSHDRPTAGPRPNSTTSYGTGAVGLSCERELTKNEKISKLSMEN